jgi:hypothetical protein
MRKGDLTVVASEERSFGKRDYIVKEKEFYK